MGLVVGLKQPDEAPALMTAITGLGWPDAAPSTFLAEALRLMQDRRVTFDDAVYHATAIVSAGTFVTTDTAYVRKAGAEGCVVSLTEWRLVGR